MVTPTPDTRLAVLIDADNASARHLERLLVEIAKFGTATVRRAYGDWTTPNLGPWKAALLEHSVQPVQQFSYTTGKGSTDSALIIDAMDLLHAGTVDGFCLVSSDSDFTRLAARIREEGLKAYGFGERKTPKPFVAACTMFVYVENLEAPVAASKEPGAAPVKVPPLPHQMLATAVATAAGDDGWAHLGAVGSNLSKLASDFDSRTWGHAKLADLFRAHPRYEVESRKMGEGKTPNAYVRRTVASRSSN
jgi:hypothetical protein